LIAYTKEDSIIDSLPPSFQLSDARRFVNKVYRKLYVLKLCAGEAAHFVLGSHAFYCTFLPISVEDMVPLVLWGVWLETFTICESPPKELSPNGGRTRVFGGDIVE
jgi:hypothetical protein